MFENESYQKTLAKPAIVKGKGLHTGKDVTLTIKPAAEDTGIVFLRIDLKPSVEIPALANFVYETIRGTTLEKEGVKIHTPEHLLAALVGFQIDNAIIEIDNVEVPILDGSSKDFISVFEAAGRQEQKVMRELFVPKSVITFKDELSGSEIIMIPDDKPSVSVMIDFETDVLGSQTAKLENIDDFKTHIAPCRTFSFLHDLEQLLENGLIKGGDLNNAIIYVDKPLEESNMEKLKEAFGRKSIAVKPNGILDNLTLNFPNEAARHKLLDVLGDLSLIGMPIRAKIIASKPGHKINTAFAKKVSSIISELKRKDVPQIDFSKDPVKDVNQIMEMLPHLSLIHI